jgi:uncharacterized damage-inducible protein DinB
MTVIEALRAQLAREVQINRRVLAKVPEGQAEWKPHSKSMPLGYLAMLVATMPTWIAMAIRQDALDLAPADGSGPKPQEWKTAEDLLAALEDAAKQAEEALSLTTADHLETNWQLLVTGKVVMTAPRRVVIEDTLTHMAHHRGQLTVYMRLNDAHVPSVYGPTADEPAFS